MRRGIKGRPVGDLMLRGRSGAAFALTTADAGNFEALRRSNIPMPSPTGSEDAAAGRLSRRWSGCMPTTRWRIPSAAAVNGAKGVAVQLE